MKVLCVTPHLGGGIGKAHATMSRIMPKEVQQIYVLLEKPIDLRFVHTIRSSGGSVVVSEGPEHLAHLAKAADVVQFEFINHPRLLECMAMTEWPRMRSVIWAHISGLYKPIIQPGLMDAVEAFVFSTEASRPLGGERTNISVINSGFGFGTVCSPLKPKRLFPVVCYLGTVNFVKMHPSFFDCIDQIDHVGPVQIWGAVDKDVKALASSMKYPSRVKFMGETLRPAEALSSADVFFYPLQPKHYGTGENALVEAMGLGLTSVVLSNPAEQCIVKHNKTGFVAKTIEECTQHLDFVISNQTVRSRVGRAAIDFVSESKKPQLSVDAFVSLWSHLLDGRPKKVDFKAVLGETPLDWYLATQHPKGVKGPIEDQGFKGASKGSLTHFKRVFANDRSLSCL